jgi:hypothetical protein
VPRRNATVVPVAVAGMDLERAIKKTAKRGRISGKSYDRRGGDVSFLYRA